MSKTMDKITFSSKWNTRHDHSKIDLNCFTSIRLEGPKWILGNWYKVILTGSSREYAPAKLVDIKPFLLKNLTEYVARIDTGYSREVTQGIIQKMYPQVDFEKRRLVLLTFAYKPE